MRLLLLTALTLLLAPAAAQAARGPCIAGQSLPICEVWYGTVHTIGDGDTFDVDIDRDGTRERRRIRVVGVQAMELTDYATTRRVGECHGVEATELTERLIRRGRSRVRMAALDAESMSRGRLMRSVAVRSGKRWRDLGTSLLSRGLGLWLPGANEWQGNVLYSGVVRGAIAGQRGLFDPDACGAGPAGSLALDVQWDADGNDATNPAGEWVRVRNLDPANPVALGGWYLRDASLRRFVFPASAVVPAGGALTVNVGQDGDGLSVLAWGQRAPVFENASRDERAMGDGAYLFDPLGNVRATFLYPCRAACPDPLQGAVELSAQPRGAREYVAVRNVSAGPVDLGNRLLKNRPYSYVFAAGTVLQPGEALRVQVVGASEGDTPLLKHWGLARQILRDGGDVVELDTFGDLTLACAAYGDAACPSEPPIP